MEVKISWEALFQDCGNPCCVTDMENDTIVFMNPAMKNVLNEFEIGGLCYEIIQGREERCVFCPNDKLKLGTVEETYIYNEKVKRFFRVNHTLLEFGDKKFNLCKYFVAPTFEEQQQGYEEAMYICQKIIKAPEEDQISMFLEVLGKFYNADKAHLYRFDGDAMELTLVEAWTKGEIFMHQTLSKEISVEKVMGWISQENEMGIIEANTLLLDFDHNSMGAEILKTFHLDNIMLSQVGKDGEKVDYLLGVSNHRGTEYDCRLLKVVSELLNHVGDPESLKKNYEYMKDYDILTGFFSRESCSIQIDQLQKQKLDSLGVLFVSINGLKQSNEDFGSRSGIAQTRNCAELLTNHFCKDFYRVNAGEFVAFFENIKTHDCLNTLHPLRKRMKEANNFPFTMGYAVHSGRIDIEEIISEAATITTINKQRYYHRIRKTENPSSHPLLNNLLKYLNNDEFMVYLQAQVDMETREVIGAEALIRRFDKENQRMVFPDEFIPLYEKESIIRHVDIFVLRKVCEILKKWGETHRQIPISVNFSRVTLTEFDIVDTIADICDDYGIDHNMIVVEVTERVGLIENDVESTLIQEFHEKGFRISLDDFGCAYSNIVTLAKIDVNEVKIDKSLVDNLTSSEKNKALVEKILQVCNSFDKTHTLAEGIENEHQAEILKNFVCTYGQGYLFSRPIPHEDFFQKYIVNQ